MPTAFTEAIAKVEAAKPSQSDVCDALPDECAVEAEGVRGEKRIDYKKVPIRNADGTLNKAGKNLLDLNRPAAEAGKDIVEKLRAGDLDDKPQMAAEVERKRPLDPRVAAKVAEMRGLRPARACGIRAEDETGRPNLWRDSNGHLVRIALVGTRESSRIETYPA